MPTPANTGLNAMSLIEGIQEIIRWHDPTISGPIPEPEDYDDTESAYNNGSDIAAWEITQKLRKLLAGDKSLTKEEAARLGLLHLAAARDLMKEAGAKRTLARLRSTISSAKGAIRAAGYRMNREHVEERDAINDRLEHGQRSFIHDGWTGSDAGAAEAEGWNVFDCGNGQLVIEADSDNPTPFGSDNMAAFAYVEKRAAEGSDMHKRALKLCEAARTPT